jgi:CheY-like chemotaxis protein/anti-sigma regulatory factor (Ser/Thr protein kinase)
MFTEHSQQKNLKLTLSLSPDLPENVIGDPMRLYQVLSNLIGNAVKFTHSGEIIVNATVVQRKLERAVIQFSVSDTGIGIAEEKIALLFESFTQADSSTARKYGGTGLGLTICKRLVALMGGKLAVDSEVGGGSVFSFALNLALNGQERHNDGSGGTSETAAAMASIRYAYILLVEDNVINQQVAQEILAKANLHVETVNNGKEAVEAVAARDFDAVLMDIQMPVMDGYEATVKIRQELKKADLPILAMTAHAVSEERDKCFRLGMNDHIAKPINRNNLFMTLSKWIRKKSDRGRRLAQVNAGRHNRATTGKHNSPRLRELLTDAANGDAPVGLDLAEGLQRLEGNEQLYMKLLRSFCREQKNPREKIENIIRKHDEKAAQYFAHSLKGVAGNIGMSALQKLSSEVEKKSGSGTPEEWEKTLHRLADELTTIVQYLTPRVNKNDEPVSNHKESTPAKDFDRNIALYLLRQLATLLEQSDFSSLQFLENNQARIKPLFSEQAILHLFEYIEDFSFDAALILINENLEDKKNETNADPT